MTKQEETRRINQREALENIKLFAEQFIKRIDEGKNIDNWLLYHMEYWHKNLEFACR